GLAKFDVLRAATADGRVSRIGYNLRMRIYLLKPILPAVFLAIFPSALLLAQPPANAGGRGAGKGPARPVLSVTSSSFPDGGEVPLKSSFYGDNKSPDFTFNWTLAGATIPPPDGLQTYAVIFHDIENATNKGPADTLHWSAFNVPGTAKGLSEGLASGDLPDG